MAGDDLLMQRHGRHAGLDDGLDLFQKGESVRSSARCAPDGYQILSAQSAAEGFALLALHEVHVILCDQHMPVMNGTVFLDRVKDMYPDTLRIVLSDTPTSIRSSTRSIAARFTASTPSRGIAAVEEKHPGSVWLLSVAARCAARSAPRRAARESPPVALIRARIRNRLEAILMVSASRVALKRLRQHLATVSPVAPIKKAFALARRGRIRASCTAQPCSRRSRASTPLPSTCPH